MRFLIFLILINIFFVFVGCDCSDIESKGEGSELSQEVFESSNEKPDRTVSSPQEPVVYDEYAYPDASNADYSSFDHSGADSIKSVDSLFDDSDIKNDASENSSENTPDLTISETILEKTTDFISDGNCQSDGKIRCNPIWHVEIKGVCVPKQFFNAKNSSGYDSSSTIMWSYVKYDFRDNCGVVRTHSVSRIWLRCYGMFCKEEIPKVLCENIKWYTAECHFNPLCRRKGGHGALHGLKVYPVVPASGNMLYYVDIPEPYDGAHPRDAISSLPNGNDPTDDNGPGWPTCWRKDWKEFTQVGGFTEYNWRPGQAHNGWLSRPKVFVCSLTQCLQ